MSKRRVILSAVPRPDARFWPRSLRGPAAALIPLGLAPRLSEEADLPRKERGHAKPTRIASTALRSTFPAADKLPMTGSPQQVSVSDPAGDGQCQQNSRFPQFGLDDFQVELANSQPDHT